MLQEMSYSVGGDFANDAAFLQDLTDDGQNSHGQLEEVFFGGIVNWFSAKKNMKVRRYYEKLIKESKCKRRTKDLSDELKDYVATELIPHVPIKGSII